MNPRVNCVKMRAMTEPGSNARLYLRPDLDRLAKEGVTSFSFEKKEEMPDAIVLEVIGQHPVLGEAPYVKMRSLATECVDEIERLHNVPDIVGNPPSDIDVIWVIGAPGLLLERGSKPGWSSQYPWMDNLEWENFGSAFALEIAVTAKRLGKDVGQITRGDVLKSGPWLIYNDPAYEPVKIILQESSGIPIPLGKILLYGEFTDKDGNVVPIRNTVDQVDSIRMPEGVSPRKIAICVLAAQMVRLGRLLAKTNNLPEGAEVLVVPTPSPLGHEREHAILECQGAVINYFKHENAERTPINYKTD